MQLIGYKVISGRSRNLIERERSGRSMLQYVAVCCSMLQYVAVCCSMLQYVERLDHFFLANNIIDGDKKRAVFLSVVGPKPYRMLTSLLSARETRREKLSSVGGAFEEAVQSKTI